MKHTFRKIWTGTAAVLAVVASITAPAQEYPAKPVRIIIGFPPGGATDLVSRLMAPKYTGLFKQQFIVDNRPGANGVIGSDLVAKAAPDGYVIHLATIGSLVLSPATSKVPYDPLKDFAPISQAVALQNIFIVHPNLPPRTLKELIALAKARPGALNFASSGNASPGHLAGELFKSMAKVNLVHVPYKGGGPAMVDLVAGHVEIFVAVISTAVPQVKAGKARALAVTGPRRAAALPDVPTVVRVRVEGLRSHQLVRLCGAAEYAPRHHRAAAQGNRDGARNAGCEANAARPGHRGRAEFARAVRGLHQVRNRQVDQGDQGFRHEG